MSGIQPVSGISKSPSSHLRKGASKNQQNNGNKASSTNAFRDYLRLATESDKNDSRRGDQKQNSKEQGKEETRYETIDD